MKTLYLASGSPRRREILENLGYQIRRIPADIDETPFPDENAADYVQRMANEKNAAAVAQWFSQHDTPPEFPILTADTTVAYQNHILGKPETQEHAEDMVLIGKAKRAASCKPAMCVSKPYPLTKSLPTFKAANRWIKPVHTESKAWAACLSSICRVVLPA